VEWGWGGGEERGPGEWETVITWEWFVAAPARAHSPIQPSPATHTHVFACAKDGARDGTRDVLT